MRMPFLVHQVACSDGKVFKQDESAATRVGPVLTDAEMEAKYRWAMHVAVVKGGRTGQLEPSLRCSA